MFSPRPCRISRAASTSPSPSIARNIKRRVLSDGFTSLTECIDQNWFLTLNDARRKMEEWRRDYNEVRPHSAIGNKTPILLQNGSNGLLYDDRGNRLSSTHTLKPNGKRYRYYTSQAMLQDNPEDAGSLPRLPAASIEEIIFQILRKFITDQEDASWQNASPHDRMKHLKFIIKRIEVGESNVQLSLNKKACDKKKVRSQIKNNTIEICSDGTDEMVISFPTKIHKWRGEKIIETPTSSEFASKSHPNKALIKAVTKAFEWRELLENGQARTIAEIAQNNGCTGGHVRHILKLGFLAPNITKAILNGNQPRKLTHSHLVGSSLPQSWSEQRQQLGFS